MLKGILKTRKTPHQNGTNLKVKVTGQLNGWFDIYKVLFCIYKMVIVLWGINPHNEKNETSETHPHGVIFLNNFHFLFTENLT